MVFINFRKQFRIVSRYLGKNIRDQLLIFENESKALRISQKSMRTRHGVERSLLLVKLASQSAKKGLDILEAGVFRGGSAQLIIDSLTYQEVPINIFLIDTFSGHPSTSVTHDVDGKQRIGQFKNTDYDEVSDFLKGRLVDKNLRAFVI